MEIEVIDNNFQYPKNLRNMSAEEKERLNVRYANHRSIISDRENAETNPSQVMDISEIQAIRDRRRRAIEQNRAAMRPAANTPVYDEGTGRQVGRFVPDVGYVIDSVEGTRRVSKEEAEQIKNAAYETDCVRKENEKYSQMSDAERDAEDRFGNLFI